MTENEQNTAPEREENPDFSAENQEKKQKLTPKQNFIQVMKFVLFSCGAGIIQIATFTLMNEVFHWNYWVSYLIALVLSVLYNFTVNRRYTFKSASNVPKAMLLVFAFYAAFTPYSTWLTNFLTGNKGLNEYLVLVICMVQNLTLEFLWNRFVVYRKSINSNDIAKKEALKTAEKEETTDDKDESSEGIEETTQINKEIAENDEEITGKNEGTTENE